MLHPLAPFTPEIRRIALDGHDGVPAPAETSGPDGIVTVHDVPTPALEIYPCPAQRSRGTVLISPGGAYSFLSINMEGREIAQMLNDAGWDAAVLFYTVDAGFDTRSRALADAENALRLLQNRGDEFELSKERIGALGFSAGGHLTARLAHAAAARGLRPPEFLVLIYPAYLEEDGKIIDDVRPIGVPVFVCVGDADPYMPSSVAYAAACEAQGRTCEYVVLAGGVHGLWPTPENPIDMRKVWPLKLRPFLDAFSAAEA